MLAITLPGAVRDTVRTMVRNQPGFEAFRLANGSFKSRDLNGELLVRAINDLGLESIVRAMVAQYAANLAANPMPVAPVAPAMPSPDGMSPQAHSGPTNDEKREVAKRYGMKLDEMQRIIDVFNPDKSDVTMLPPAVPAAPEPVEEDSDSMDEIVMPHAPHAPTASTSDVMAMAESVLDPLRPFVLPSILAKVESALAPLVALAEKPAIEIERVVTVAGPGTGSAPAVGQKHAAGRLAATMVGQTTLGAAFGFGRVADAKRTVGRWNSPYAPPVDQFYVPDPSTLGMVSSAIERGEYVWLAGPMGSGKTTLPEQYAARTCRPFCHYGFRRDVESVELIGMREPDGMGGMIWHDGLLPWAIRQPGMIIMLDEITMVPPGLCATIQTLLSNRYITLPTGERVDCAPGVVFVAGDNTRGYGDDTGIYGGTMASNGAFVDRFARMVEVDYLPFALESQALANRTRCPLAAAEHLVRYIGNARKLDGFDIRPLSMRRLVAFVNMCLDGYSPEIALHNTFLTRLPDAERETLRQHWRAEFRPLDFKALLDGAPLPAPVAAPTPKQVDAMRAFSTVDTTTI